MQVATDEADVLTRTIRWTERHSAVRLVLLTSSRARPEGPVDILSDYDVVLFVTDPAEFLDTEDWIAEFGPPLLVVRDGEVQFGVEKSNRMVLYDDGAKVDYSIWPITVIALIDRAGRLPEEFDVGYRVLLDKDSQAGRLPPPSFTAHIPPPPTEREYQSLIQEFWFCATYVAKYLWRNELMPAKVILDYEMTYLIVRRMLEWRIELDHQWSVRPGFFGRGLRRHLDAATWAELQAAYVGPEPEAIWTGLERTIGLFRRVTVGVGRDLGYSYPWDIDAKLSDYLRQIKQLP